MGKQAQHIKYVLYIVVTLCFMMSTLLTRIYAQSNGRLSELENVISMAWNSDGSTLALSAIFSGQPGIWFYDAVSGEITSGIQSSPLYLNLSWSPDDTMIVGASGNEFGYTYSVFRVVDAQLVSQFDAGSRPLAVNWSADSSLVMLGDTESVILYDAFDGSIERVLSVPSNLPSGGGISSTAWDTENDRAYAVYAVRDILIWNSTTTELINAVEFPNSVIFPIALNGSGDELAVQGPNGQVLLVDPTTLSINHTLQAPNDETIRDIVWHEDNVHLVTFGGDEIIRIWNLVTASVVEEIAIGALITGPPVWRPGTNELAYSISNGTPTIQTVEALPIYPTADAGPDQIVTDENNSGSESVTLDGSASSDSDGTITSYVWTKNSTQIATGATPTVDLAVGTHIITLTVTDNDGATATDEVVITVNAPTSVTCDATVTASDVPGLVSAINTANSSGGADTICLDASTYTLNAVQNNNYGPNGLPAITSEITLVGLGGGATIERAGGSPSFRFFRITSGGTLTLDNLTLIGGNESNGGAIYNEGSLTLTNSTLQNNSAGRGGAIRSDSGTVTLTDSTISGNTASSEGGGIYSVGTLALNNSDVLNNTAPNGAGLFNNGGAVTLDGSTLNGNDATGRGGGIRSFNGGSLVVSNGSAIDRNNADIDGGGIYAESMVTITDSQMVLRTGITDNSKRQSEMLRRRKNAS